MITHHKIYDNMTKDDWKFSTWSQVCVFMRKICHSQIPQTCNNLDHVRLLKSYRPLLKAQFWKPFTQTHFFSLRVTSNLDSRLSSFISHVHFSWYLILSICIFQWHSTLFRGCKLNSCIPLFLILVSESVCCFVGSFWPCPTYWWCYPLSQDLADRTQQYRVIQKRLCLA